ncbi:hypothetical protein PP707_01420 [Acetobacter pasteurianus]|nr:hypothetical protein [Acetobacter pasteurianus]
MKVGEVFMRFSKRLNKKDKKKEEEENKKKNVTSLVEMNERRS